MRYLLYARLQSIRLGSEGILGLTETKAEGRAESASSLPASTLWLTCFPHISLADR